MKANAPEKIYLKPLLMEDGESIVRRCTFERQRDSQIEYTRTDAFIEKACEFISLNVNDYIDVTHKGGIEHVTLQERFIDVFRKYMKGE